MVQRPLVLLATIFAGLLIVLSFALVLMPDMVATQPAAFNTGAPPLPKLFCVSLPTVLMVMFGYLGSKDRKMYFGSLIGVVLHILFWLTN